MSENDVGPRNPRRREEVTREIRESFASSEYPGDAQLMELDPEDDPDTGEIFEVLQGKSWTELLADLERLDGPDLYWFCWVYSMLTPGAFFYYLPAFLAVSLDLARVDTVGSHLIYMLSAPDKIEEAFRRRYVTEVINRATPSQRAAIQNWARYLIEEYPEFGLLTAEVQQWL